MKNAKKSKQNILRIGILVILFIIIKSVYTYATDEIPKVYFQGDITEMTEKADKRDIYVKFSSSDINFEANAKLSVQGTSSLIYKKKNYNITFYQDDTYEEKQKIDVGRGWGAQNKYCLKANWIDKTHARNIVSARIASKIQKKYGLFTDTPNYGLIDGFPVEIYSNNEFLGLYTWNIPKSDWMWGLDENNPNNIALVGDEWTDQVMFRKKIKSLDEAKWEVEIGEENQETIDKFNRVINFVAWSLPGKFKEDYELYFNKDAVLNYIIMIYVMQAGDNLGKNLAMVTYDGQIWYPTLYDLDSTWGTWSDGEKYEVYNLTPENAGQKNKLLIRTIKAFRQELAERWFELRKDELKKENILEEFNTFINSIPEETYQKEREHWGNAPGYDIDQIEDYLDYRLEYVDNLMTYNLHEDFYIRLYICGGVIFILIVTVTVIGIKKYRKKRK